MRATASSCAACPVLGEKIQRRAPRNAAEFLVVGAKVLRDQRGVILRGEFSGRGGCRRRCGGVHALLARCGPGFTAAVNCSVSVLPAIAPVECAPALMAVCTASK